MPYTQDQKDWIIKESGFDPSTHEMVDDNFIRPKAPVATPTAQPAALSNGLPQPKIRPAGQAETFVKEAIHSAPAAAAGGLGAWGGAALGQTLIPIPFVGAGIGALAGGLAAGMGTSYAQNKIEQAVV